MTQGQPRGARAWAVRGAAVALVALAVADATIAGPRTPRRAVRVVDVSDSVGGAARERDRDPAGLHVVFAATARRVLPGEGASGLARDATRISAGLEEAAAVLGDEPGAALLVTDGRDTGGDALAAAARFASLGHRLHVAPPSGGVADVGLLWARGDATPGRGVRVLARVESSSPGLVRVVLLRAGRRVDVKEVSLAPGRAEQVVLEDPAPAGETGYEVRLEPEPGLPDDDAADDRLRVFVREEARAALVRGEWPDIEPPAGLTLRTVARVEPADLDAVDLLVLSDVPRRDLPAVDLLARFLARGGRLLVLGGPDAWESGGWAGTAFESMLPLRTKPPEGAERAFVVALDRSGSAAEPLPGGGTRLARLVQAVRALVDDLVPAERVAVIPFADRPGPPLEPGWLTSEDVAGKTTLASAMRSLSPSGGTDLAGAVAAAARHLAPSTARERRVVLVTDGDPDDPPTPESFAPAREALEAASARLVALVAGDAATVERLRLAAGPLAEVVDVASVEAVEAALARSVRDLRGRAEREVGPFVVEAVADAGDDVARLEMLSPSVLARLVPAPGAAVAATASRERDVFPFLATAAAGAGRVVALSWGPAWEREGGAVHARGLRPLLASLAGEADRGLEATPADGRVTVAAPDLAGAGSLALEGEAGGARSVLWERQPGVFEGREPTPLAPGEALLARTAAGLRPLRLPSRPPPEHAGAGVDEAMLDALARAGGGLRLPAGAPAPVVATGERVRLAPWFLLTALALLVVDRAVATSAGASAVASSAVSRRGAA